MKNKGVATGISESDDTKSEDIPQGGFVTFAFAWTDREDL